jgi:hypothetical protein
VRRALPVVVKRMRQASRLVHPLTGPTGSVRSGHESNPPAPGPAPEHQPAASPPRWLRPTAPYRVGESGGHCRRCCGQAAVAESHGQSVQVLASADA